MPINRLMTLFWSVVFLLFGTAHIMPLDWWYVKGISAGDVLFCFFGVVEVVFFATQEKLKYALVESRFLLVGLLLVVASLLSGVFFNYHYYIDFRVEYLLWVLRLTYFAVMVPVIAYVVSNRLAVDRALRLYLTGMAIALVSNMANDFVVNIPNERCGLYIWSNPNVIGNFLCIGLLYMALWLKQGAAPRIMYCIFLVLFCFSAFLSFSKATWIMLLLGNILLIIQSVGGAFKSKRTGDTFSLKSREAVCLFSLAVFWAMLLFQGDKVACFVNLKVISSAPSLEIRKNYAVSALDVAKTKPLGIGVGRYAEFTTGVPVTEAEASQVGFSSAGNPHSALLYLAASGGWGAVLGFIFFIGSLAYAFVKALQLPLSKRMNFLVGSIFGVIVVVSSSFQLQVVTQSFLFVLAGVVIAAALNAPKQEV